MDPTRRIFLGVALGTAASTLLFPGHAHALPTKLEQYVGDIIAHNAYPNAFPETLQLSDALIKLLQPLYTNGEAKGVEFGGNLMYDAHMQSITLVDVCEGAATTPAVQIPARAENANFADVHSHPSKSIGHKDGYSSHSVADFLVLQHHLNKPVFIRFVVSGPFIYAVVFRKDYSSFAKAEIEPLRDEQASEEKKFFEAHCPVKADVRQEQLGHCSNSIEMNALLVKWKLATPGLGEYLQNSAAKYCQQVTRKYHYGLYASAKGKPGLLHAFTTT